MLLLSGRIGSGLDEGYTDAFRIVQALDGSHTQLLRPDRDAALLEMIDDRQSHSRF